MKYVKMLLVVLVFGLLLCGCQKTPDEVIENIEQYGDNPQLKASEVLYYSVDELKETKLSDIGVKVNNLELPSDVDFSNVEKVEVLHLLIEDNFLEDNIIEKYTELFGIENKKLKKREAGESSWGNSLLYEEKNIKKHFDMFENGGMAYIDGLSYDIKPNVIEKKYNLDREDVSEVNVLLSDGDVNLAEMCEEKEKWLDNNMHIDGISYKISDVFVRAIDTDDNELKKLSMCAEYEYKGIRFNNHTSPLAEETEDYSSRELTTFLATELEYEDSGLPSFFSRNIDVSIDYTENIEKVVDFESAINILEETISGFGVFHISEIIPLYALYLKNNEEAPGAGIEARPVYAFLVKKELDDFGRGIIKINGCEHFFFIDMVTGELTTDLDVERK